jgi:hypothetical protein
MARQAHLAVQERLIDMARQAHLAAQERLIDMARQAHLAAQERLIDLARRPTWLRSRGSPPLRTSHYHSRQKLPEYLQRQSLVVTTL